MPEPGRLFELDQVAPEPTAVADRPEGRLVRVLPDVSGIDREFDYVVPERWRDEVAVGTLVRIDLHNRRVPGWVTALDVEPGSKHRLRPIMKVSSVGPSAEIVDLARWAARRWCGPVRAVLKSASPPRMVRSLPTARSHSPSAGSSEDEATGPYGRLVADALDAGGTTVIQVAPIDDGAALVGLAAARGNVLVVMPGVGAARRLAGRVGRLGHRVHLQPSGWATGASGGVVVGTRSAVWAPTGPIDVVVVLDEHDESLQEERVPTWHGRDVAVERARRAGAPCLLVSPAPSLRALAVADRVVRVPRSAERAGWPPVEVVDRRDEEPGLGLFSARAAAVFRDADRPVAILNRKGRARMLVCGSCGEVVMSEDGEHLMVEVEGGLVAPATGERRPLICAVCAGTGLKRLRLGVTRAAEDLSRLVGREVIEWTAEADRRDAERPVRGRTPIVLGTEAALHAVSEADAVVFLDFDQEMLAPRYRAAEQAMGLLVRAARLAGGRRGGGRILVQTRSPEHRVLRAAVAADPGRMVDEELTTRTPLGLPPVGALAELSGAGAEDYAADLMADGAVTVLGPREDGRYLLRADDAEVLAQVLERVSRPKARIRIAADPPRI